MSSEKKLAKNTLILSICTLLNKGLMFIMLPFFTRWLTVEDYGIYDLFTTYVSLLIPIITIATSNAVFRLSIDSEEKNRNNYIMNGLILVLFNFFISSLIILIIDYFCNLTLIIPFLILLFGELLDNYFQGYLRALKKIFLYGICKSITVIVTAITVTIFVKFLNLGLSGMIYGYALGFYISSLFIIFKTKFWECLRSTKLSISSIKELISYSWALVPNDISWWIINVSDRQIINMFLGATANGIYAIAYKLPNLCASVFGVFNVSWQETATENINNKDRTIFYENILNKTFSIIVSLCIGILACNFLFFDYIFDSRYISARFYTPILIVSIIFSTLSLFYGGIQISLKRPKANGISTVIGAIVNLAVHILLIKNLGLYAAALSTLISNMVVFAIRKSFLKDTFKLKINKKSYFYILFLVYFSIVAMFKFSLFINLVNLTLATFLFIYINMDIVKKVLKR